MDIIASAQFEAEDAGVKAVGADWDHDQFNPYVKIYYITEGEGEVTAGKQVIALKPGRLYLIPAHMSLQMRCRERMVHYWVHLIITLEGGLDLLSFTGSSLELIPRDPDKVKIQMERIEELYPAKRASDEMELQGLYRFLVARFMHERGQNELTLGEMSIFQPTLEYIDQHLQAPLTNDELAALHHWHPTYFANRFAKAVGTSPRHYILRKRIARSQNLLTTGTLTLAEIAKQVGFRDPYYFSRAFKQVCGIPPGRYRQQRYPIV